MKTQIARATLVALAAVYLASGSFAMPAGAASRDPKISAAIQKGSGEWMVMSRDAETAIKNRKYELALQKYNAILEQRKNLGLDLMVQQLALADVYEKMKQLDKADQFHRDAIAGRAV